MKKEERKWGEGRQGREEKGTESDARKGRREGQGGRERGDEKENIK